MYGQVGLCQHQWLCEHAENHVWDNAGEDRKPNVLRLGNMAFRGTRIILVWLPFYFCVMMQPLITGPHAGFHRHLLIQKKGCRDESECRGEGGCYPSAAAASQHVVGLAHGPVAGSSTRCYSLGCCAGIGRCLWLPPPDRWETDVVDTVALGMCVLACHCSPWNSCKSCFFPAVLASPRSPWGLSP